MFLLLYFIFRNKCFLILGNEINCRDATFTLLRVNMFKVKQKIENFMKTNFKNLVPFQKHFVISFKFYNNIS